MGKKHRRNHKQRKHSFDDEGSRDDDDVNGDDQQSNNNNQNDASSSSSSPQQQKFTDLDFQQRRELQRKQAAEKRKAKQKCYLCGQIGHVRRECPGIADDGRGMSRYKGKSDPKQEKQNRLKKKQQQQQQQQHKQQQQQQLQQSNNNTTTTTAALNLLFQSIEYPPGFVPIVQQDGDNDYDNDREEEEEEHQVNTDDNNNSEIPLVYYDPHVKIVESISYMRYQRDGGKKNENVGKGCN